MERATEEADKVLSKIADTAEPVARQVTGEVARLTRRLSEVLSRGPSTGCESRRETTTEPRRQMLARRSWAKLGPCFDFTSRPPTPGLTAVRADLPSFLIDHASCERKASALALSLVSHYPDRPDLVREMIALAQEELEHFRQVHELLEERDLRLGRDVKDAYVGGLLAELRQGSEPYFLDRLLIAGIVEARGCERFRILGDGLPPGPLSSFYVNLARAEARHHALFVRLARQYFNEHEVQRRLTELLTREAEIVRSLPTRGSPSLIAGRFPASHGADLPSSAMRRRSTSSGLSSAPTNAS